MPLSSSYWWFALESMIGGTRAAAVATEKKCEPHSGFRLPFCRLHRDPPRLRRVRVAAPAGSKVELALTATEETWLSVSSDGTPIFSGLLEANQTKTIEGKDVAKLRVGNAAGLEVRLNGKPLGPLGAHGQVRDLVFTPDKFQIVSPTKESE